MGKIRVTEVFGSPFLQGRPTLQGEGRFVGRPSVFIRTFGCPFRCRGFGMPAGQLTDEPMKILEMINDPANNDKYKTLKDLPLALTGCDSYAAVYSEFKKFSTDYEPEELAQKVIELLPYQSWQHPYTGTHTHLVITGGEPLLGWQREYPKLLTASGMEDLRFLTFETNATQYLTKEFEAFLQDWSLCDNVWDNCPGVRDITFSCSVKLSASGEPAEKAIKPDVVMQYQSVGNTYLKFVAETPEHFDEIDQVTKTFRSEGFIGDIYVMPVGGTHESYLANAAKVADLCLERGYNYSPREHTFLWGNCWGA